MSHAVRMSTMPHPSSVTSTTPLERTEAAGAVAPRRAGVALAILMAASHLGWSFLVAVGWAQPLLDFLYRINFIQSSDEVQPFSAGTAVMLVFVSAGMGYGVGWFAARVWNRVAGVR